MADLARSAAEVEISQDDPTACKVLTRPEGPTTVTLYALTLTVINTEYSQALPANTMFFEFRCRSGDAIRWAYVTGKVAAPTDPYRVLFSGEIYSTAIPIRPAALVLYFAGTVASQVMEIEAWS